MICVKKTLIFNLLFLSMMNYGFGQSEPVDRVIAKVGGEIILLSDVEEQFSLSNQQGGGNLDPMYRCEILQNIVVSKLLLNQSRLDSIVVSEIEIETQLDARIEQILAYMGGDVEQFEAYYGKTVNETKERFREDLEEQLRIERMQGDIVGGATVTPREVKDFFARIPQDSLPYFNAEVEIAEVVYVPKVNAEQKRIALEKLEEVRDLINEGEDFAELATRFSDDPGSARIGGDLGWQGRGTFVPEFEATAYNLEEGQISDIIETEFGFHLLRLEGRRGNNIRIRHILIKPEITMPDLILAERTLDSLRQEIAMDSLSFSIAVKRYSDEAEQSYSNDGFMLNPATGNTFFEIADLDPDIYFTIDTMEVGQVSSPIEYTDQRGETKYRMVLLKSRTEPHKANLQEDYSKIRTAALEQKKGKFISSWVVDKLGDTYISLDKDYSPCKNLDEIFSFSEDN
ncbi:MAG: peptidylprolyl isomerase [Saprospiraceae bacterium]|nr:peptidylprolyl isomerase [Saprospiraceae bacterium]